MKSPVSAMSGALEQMRAMSSQAAGKTGLDGGASSLRGAGGLGGLGGASRADVRFERDDRRAHVSHQRGTVSRSASDVENPLARLDRRRLQQQRERAWSEQLASRGARGRLILIEIGEARETRLNESLPGHVEESRQQRVFVNIRRTQLAGDPMRALRVLTCRQWKIRHAMGPRSRVNPTENRRRLKSNCRLEASPGIEPGCKDLQSSA